MKTNSNEQKVPTRFHPETRFTVEFNVLASDYGRLQTAFEHLKTRLFTPVLNDALDAELRRHLTFAANEAAAVAWTTPFPLLVFPVLLEEKTAEAHRYARRQQEVHEATHELVNASP